MLNIFSTSFGINFAKLIRVWLALISLTLKSTAYFFEPPCTYTEYWRTEWSKNGHPIYFCYNFSKSTPILTTFQCYNKKCITHKYKLMCAKERVLQLMQCCYFVILFVYYVLFITPHIKRHTTVKPLKAGKNEQKMWRNSDIAIHCCE